MIKWYRWTARYNGGEREEQLREASAPGTLLLPLLLLPNITANVNNVMVQPSAKQQQQQQQQQAAGGIACTASHGNSWRNTVTSGSWLCR
jgi:hypothetical protein